MANYPQNGLLNDLTDLIFNIFLRGSLFTIGRVSDCEREKDS